MAAFPTLRTGAVAQYPSTRHVRVETNVIRFVDGAEQRFRATAGLVRRWEIRLQAADATELAAIETFFLEQQGRFGSFSFTDPWDGVEYADCSFEEDTFEARHLTETRSAARMIIRANQG